MYIVHLTSFAYANNMLDLSKTLTILHGIIRYAIQGGIELVFAYHSHCVVATKFAFMFSSQDTKRTTQVTAPYQRAQYKLDPSSVVKEQPQLETSSLPPQPIYIML